MTMDKRSTKMVLVIEKRPGKPATERCLDAQPAKRKTTREERNQLRVELRAKRPPEIPTHLWLRIKRVAREEQITIEEAKVAVLGAVEKFRLSYQAFKRARRSAAQSARAKKHAQTAEPIIKWVRIVSGGGGPGTGKRR
jgi:hypothetical protein